VIKYRKEIMKDENFPKLENSLKEVQKLPEWSAIEKVMLHDSCKILAARIRCCSRFCF